MTPTMTDKPCATHDHVEIEILKTKQELLEQADKKYAPIVVKTIVYGLIGTFAGGIVLGLGGLVTTKFIASFSQEQHETP